LTASDRDGEREIVLFCVGVEKRKEIMPQGPWWGQWEWQGE